MASIGGIVTTSLSVPCADTSPGEASNVETIKPRVGFPAERADRMPPAFGRTRRFDHRRRDDRFRAPTCRYSGDLRMRGFAPFRPFPTARRAAREAREGSAVDIRLPAAVCRFKRRRALSRPR